QQQVEIGEEEQREPAALILGPPRELGRQPDQAPSEGGGGEEREEPADVKRRSGKRPGGEAEGVEEDQSGGPLDPYRLGDHRETAGRVVGSIAEGQRPEVGHLPEEEN